jgi:predicted unusual protein kinase regulating ubiquinone biosynthesis (AarF/ABC1/UbiB family)
MTNNQDTFPKIDLKRYRKVRWFFAKVLWQIICWDILFNNPLLKWFRPDPLPRWQAVARQYKEMAMEMGGVLIKLGQFLSIRVDILPPEVTIELADLQDEVAPETYEDIAREVENDFQLSLTEIFRVFSAEPLGAASLAQAHQATLNSGDEIVIKILRPGIEQLVETDLSVMNLVCRWLKLFKTIRIRVDLDRLVEEFTKTTRNELDLIKERENIERFSEDFKGDPNVYIPKVYRDYCGLRTLTLENVYYIKITDVEGINSCGVDAAEVADKLYNIYMKQIFVTNFMHADPHPGNLFVKPLPTEKEIKAGTPTFTPDMHVPEKPNRPFQIAFIDFGMTAIVPERLKNAMRTAAIGIGTQDTRKVVQSYVMAGVLQPGADLRQLEIIHEDWFQRLWGIQMGRIQEVAFKEARYFLKEYRDLIMEMPFQFQVDLLFIGRAVGILAGISTKLDPEFDPWKKTIPYAKKFAIEELKADWQGWPEEIIMLGQHMLKIPSNLGQVLTKAKQGALSIRVSLSPETRRAIRRIDISVKRFSWTVLATGLIVCGVNLFIAGKGRLFAITLILLAVLSFLWGMRKS